MNAQNLENQWLSIIANALPIGCEIEFVSPDGNDHVVSGDISDEEEAAILAMIANL